MLRSIHKSIRNRKRQFESLENRQVMAGDVVAALPPGIDAVRPLADIQLEDQIPGGIEIPDIIIPVLDPYVGTWTNIDPETRGLTKIQITRQGGEHQVQVWGSCDPTDCDWGKSDLTMLGTSVSDETPNDYALATWDHGFKDATVAMDLTTKGIVVDVYNVFKDGTDRENYHARYMLGAKGQMYAMSDPGSDQLSEVLLGSWVNSNPNARGVTRMDVTQNWLTGSVSANTFGACLPDDCEWGKERMDLLGSSVVDETPEYAITNYEFDFKSTFVTTRFDENGDLILGTYNVFHDDSDRSNYYSEQRMWKMGDANHDGLFNSSDMVAVFQAGEYEDGDNNNSSWEEGDFDRDGDFTSADMIAAFQGGSYEAGPLRKPLLQVLPIDLNLKKIKATAIDELFVADPLDELALRGVDWL